MTSKIKYVGPRGDNWKVEIRDENKKQTLKDVTIRQASSFIKAVERNNMK